MSNVEQINVWSSWIVVQGDLLSTVETRNIKDGPLDVGTASTHTAVLKQPDDDTICCWLHIDIKPSGYYLQTVTVDSEARNVEVYTGSNEYLGTAGRDILKNTSDNSLLCRCTFKLNNDDIITSRLLLKLLSLRGKSQIKVVKLSLVLMENYGDGEEQEQRSADWSKDTMTSLSEMFNNLPPFMHSVVNGVYHGPPDVEMNCDMNKLLGILREARISKEEEKRKEVLNDKQDQVEREEIEDHDPLTTLELKLKQFVTDQMSLLEHRLETKLNMLAKRLDTIEHVHNGK